MFYQILAKVLSNVLSFLVLYFGCGTLRKGPCVLSLVQSSLCALGFWRKQGIQNNLVTFFLQWTVLCCALKTSATMAMSTTQHRPQTGLKDMPGGENQPCD